MFRKAILTASLALAVVADLGFTPATASAHPPLAPAHFGRFEVLVLRRGCWEKAGVFRDRQGAQREARRLRHRGFEVKVERC